MSVIGGGIPQSERYEFVLVSTDVTHKCCLWSIFSLTSTCHYPVYASRVVKILAYPSVSMHWSMQRRWYASLTDSGICFP